MSRIPMLAVAAFASALGPAALAEPQFPNVVYAVVGEHLLTGTSIPSRVDDLGVVPMKSDEEPPMLCGVQYGYQFGGHARFECSGGAKGEVKYQGMSGRSGTGSGSVAGQHVSICYGFTPKDAARHLVAPAGFALVVVGDKLTLQRSGT